MTDFVQSIKDKGLLQPISVKQSADGQFRLLAGERRFTACKVLHFETIPAMVYDREMTDLDMFEVELHENIHRLDFVWHERNDLIKKIDTFYKGKDGVAVAGPTALGAPTGHTLKKTAEIANVSTGKASEAIKLAKLVEQFPMLKDFKSETEVKRFLDQAQKKVVTSDNAKKYMSKPLGDRQKKLIDSYVVGDFFEGIKTVPDNFAAIVEIDPPYGIDLNKVRKSSSESLQALTMGDYHEVEEEVYPEFLTAVLKSCYPKMRDNAWLILWFDMKKTETIIKCVREAGLETRGVPAIWEKNRGQTMQPSMYLANYFESFLYCWKGRPKINTQGRSNIFTMGVPDADKRVHPTERPIKLIQEVLTTFLEPSAEGGILVPFAGSGNTILASANISRDSIAFDLSDQYKAGFINRVMEAQPPFYGTTTLITA